MFDKIHKSWHPHLANAMNSSAMSYIIHTLLPSAEYNPQPDRIFRVLEMPIDQIKVVILGQDPYPNPEHAVGLAFAVPKDTVPPYSMERIIDELVISVSHDITLEGGKEGAFDETLEHWEEQGVFLLNRSLTVQKGLPGSHSEHWKGFTEFVIRIIAKERKNVIWMLWGNDAKTMADVINEYDNQHNILEAYHPASERYGYKFIGCNHFALANEILTDLEYNPIKWINKSE